MAHQWRASRRICRCQQTQPDASADPEPAAYEQSDAARADTDYFARLDPHANNRTDADRDSLTGRQHLAGIKDALRIQGGLYRAHDRDACRSSLKLEVGPLRKPCAVLAGDGAAKF